MQYENRSNSSASFDRITPKELIRKHIADPSHKITDEDLKKLVVGVPPVEKLQQNYQRSKRV